MLTWREHNPPQALSRGASSASSAAGAPAASAVERICAAVHISPAHARACVRELTQFRSNLSCAPQTASAAAGRREAQAGTMVHFLYKKLPPPARSPIEPSLLELRS